MHILKHVTLAVQKKITTDPSGGFMSEKFSERLRRLGFGSYAEYLHSAHWADFKARYRSSGMKVTCDVCQERGVQLHHRTYIRLGNELLTDVIPLCREHHEAVHAWLKDSGRIFVEYTHEAVAFLTGQTVVKPAKVQDDYPARKKKRKKHKKGNVSKPQLVKVTGGDGKVSKTPLPEDGVPNARPSNWSVELYERFIELFPKINRAKAFNVWKSNDLLSARYFIRVASGVIQKVPRKKKPKPTTTKKGQWRSAIFRHV